METSSWIESTRAARPRWLEWLRYLSSFLILTYAIRKLIGSGQFGLAQALSTRPVGTLSGFELTWYYYGYSHAYGLILGLTQAVGGILLLFRRTALLGAAVLIPVMANILMINVFFTIAVGAEIVAALVLISCLLMLWQERQRLTSVFWSDQRLSTALGDSAEKMAVVLIAVLLLVEAVIFAKHPTR
jgi:hypothetical protein